jgi:hypothetical protein
MPGELVTILIVLAVCAYLGWRRYLNYQERLAAIQMGGDPQSVLSEEDKASPEKGPKAPRDCRLGSLVLIAIGSAYMVCIALSTGILRGVRRAVAAGVWGIIPLAIGVVLFIYSGMVRKERTGQGQQGIS